MRAFFESRTYNLSIPFHVFVAEDINFLAHWHSDYEIAYVCEGSITVGINSESKVLNPGDMSICSSNGIHYYDSGRNHTKLIIIIFKSEIIEDALSWPSKLHLGSSFITAEDYVGQNPSGDLRRRISTVFYELLNEGKNKEEYYEILVKGKMLELFALLLRHTPAYSALSKKHVSKNYESSDAEPIQQALLYLENNYKEEITLEQLSNHVNLSQFYFSRLFKKTTGMNFNVYLNHIRIDKSEFAIKSTHKPILEIAYENGFNSIRTFNRVFKSLKGCTPLSLR